MPRRYLRERYYSTPQRILVLLSEKERPTEVWTQEGIAAATLSARPTATKWLQRLAGRGLLRRERAQVEGHPLPKYVYRLNQKGRREARRLRARLRKDVVQVRLTATAFQTVPMADVPRIAASRTSLATAMSLVRKGRLELPKTAPAARKAPAPVVWGSGLRRVDRLFGRDWEMRAIDRWYASDSTILLVTGLPGIGKSALVASWVQRREPVAHVFAFELRPSTKSSALLSEFGAFLADLGRPHLASQLSEEGRVDPALLERLLVKDVAGLPILLVIDNVDQAPPEVTRLLERGLLAQRGRLLRKTILLSRRMPRWMESAADPLEVLRIRGLDATASTSLLRHRPLQAPESELRRIATSTRGHPLLLHLAIPGATGSFAAFDDYFEGELWSALGGEDRAALEMASVLRRPVPLRILESASRTRRRTIEGLLAKNLLEKTVAGGYFVHDLVRDFLTNRIRGTRLRGLHARAAETLLREREARERWEGVHHLVAAGELRRAAEFLDSEGAPLLDSVAAEEVASLSRSLPFEDMDPASACVFSEIVGDSLRILGHVGPALFQYEHARQVADRQGRIDRIPRLLRKMAFLERCRARYPRALGYLVEAHARLSVVHDAAERIEVLREMALVEQALGDVSKAAEHFSEAVDLATEMSDRSALSRALLALGSLEIQRGNRRQGLEYDLEGLRIAERSGNLTEVARGHIVVGTGHAETGQLDEAMKHYERGLEVASVLGNLRLTAYGRMDRAAALIDLRRFREAALDVQEAEGCFSVLEERDTLALLRIYEGNIERGLGRWKRAEKAWREGLADLREYGSPVDLVRAAKQIGTFFAEHGDKTQAQTLLGEARRIAIQLGNATLVSEIDGDLHALEGATLPPDAP